MYTANSVIVTVPEDVCANLGLLGFLSEWGACTTSLNMATSILSITLALKDGSRWGALLTQMTDWLPFKLPHPIEILNSDGQWILIINLVPKKKPTQSWLSMLSEKVNGLKSSLIRLGRYLRG